MTVATIQKNAREDLRISVEEFRGVPLVNLRVWYRHPVGDMRPGKHGVALRVELLPERRAALEEAEAEARRLGFLGAGDGQT